MHVIVQLITVLLQIRLLQNQCGVLSIDYRCSSNGCWYCENKCICCMKPVAPWSGVGIDIGGFCSRLCKSLFCDDPTENMPPVLSSSSEKSAYRITSLQLQGTVRPSGASLNVIDSLHLCLGDSSCSPFGRPFIIWQFRKTNGQVFANCFLDERCCPQGLVWDSQFELDDLPSITLLESLADRIKAKVLFALNKEGFTEFNAWISYAHRIREHKTIDLSKRAPELVSMYLIMHLLYRTYSYVFYLLATQCIQSHFSKNHVHCQAVYTYVLL